MNNGYNNTLAMVLGSTDYGESDRIITFYTADYGKVKGIAKGVRKSRRRFVNKLEPFSSIHLSFFHKENRELVRVEECKIMYDFSNIKTDIENLSYGSYMLELLGAMTREGQKNKPVFNLLLKFLEMLDEGENPEKVVMFFEMRLLSILGYHPHIDRCVTCMNVPGGGKMYYFSSKRGGIVCEDCKGGLSMLIPISTGTVRFLLSASRIDLNKLNRLIPNTVIMREGRLVLNDFIRYHIGKELKTRRFIERMFVEIPFPHGQARASYANRYTKRG
jgi:DNA repair protein RecO (recombination protein O)